MESIGQSLRFYRRLADRPQYDIAKRVGHSPGWLCLVEKDVLIPKPDDLKKLKNVLKIPECVSLGDE